MSRSYRKHPISTDGSPRTTKEMKRHANSKVRNTKGTYNGGSYKKLFCSYNIHDYVSRWSKEDAIKEWFDEESDLLNKILSDGKWTLHSKYGTLKNYLDRRWAKWFKRK